MTGLLHLVVLKAHISKGNIKIGLVRQRLSRSVGSLDGLLGVSRLELSSDQAGPDFAILRRTLTRLLEIRQSFRGPSRVKQSRAQGVQSRREPGILCNCQPEL